MKRVGILIGFLILLVIGGGLTAQIAASGTDGSWVPAIVQQVGNPDADPAAMVAWKAEQLFLMIGFLLFNLIGIGFTLALVFWFLDRQARIARASVGTGTKATNVERSE